jgi:hypothetical protein
VLALDGVGAVQVEDRDGGGSEQRGGQVGVPGVGGVLAGGQQRHSAVGGPGGVQVGELRQDAAEDGGLDPGAVGARERGVVEQSIQELEQRGGVRVRLAAPHRPVDGRVQALRAGVVAVGARFQHGGGGVGGSDHRGDQGPQDVGVGRLGRVDGVGDRPVGQVGGLPVELVGVDGAGAAHSFAGQSQGACPVDRLAARRLLESVKDLEQVQVLQTSERGGLRAVAGALRGDSFAESSGQRGVVRATEAGRLRHPIGDPLDEVGGGEAGQLAEVDLGRRGDDGGEADRRLVHGPGRAIRRLQLGQAMTLLGTEDRCQDGQPVALPQVRDRLKALRLDRLAGALLLVGAPPGGVRAFVDGSEEGLLLLVGEPLGEGCGQGEPLALHREVLAQGGVGERGGGILGQGVRVPGDQV